MKLLSKREVCGIAEEWQRKEETGDRERGEGENMMESKETTKGKCLPACLLTLESLSFTNTFSRIIADTPRSAGAQLESSVAIS